MICDMYSWEYALVTGPSKDRTLEEVKQPVAVKVAHLEGKSEKYMMASKVVNQALAIAMDNAKRARLTRPDPLDHH